MTVAKLPRWAVDIMGGAFVGTLLLLAGWLGIVENAEARGLCAELGPHRAAARRTLETLGAQRRDVQQALAEHERVLADVPAHGGGEPPEAYLQTVSQIAREHDVRVILHRQLGERRYPGLRERLFAFHVSGMTAGIWRLLRAIEKVDAWADVSYVRIEAGAEGSEGRLAAITLSVFSETTSETSPGEGDRDNE